MTVLGQAVSQFLKTPLSGVVMPECFNLVVNNANPDAAPAKVLKL
jgi:hypothetical protein